MLSTSSLSYTLYSYCSTIVLLVSAPLIAGILAKFRAMIEGRQGPRILQCYYDLAKLCNKESIVPESSSWIFRLYPYLALALLVLLSLAIPVLSTVSIYFNLGDAVFVFGILLLIAFLSTLAAMDTGTAFAGLGASRESFTMMLIEPTVLVLIMSLAVEFQTTNLFAIVTQNIADRSFLLHPNMVFTAVAFLIIIIVECKRFPVDNPNTHLELTMVHEALLLEYSGKYLALLEYCSMLKFTLLASLFFSLFYPYGISLELSPSAFGQAAYLWLVKMLAFCLIFAIFEKSTAKLRVFRIPELTSFSLALAMIAIFAHYFIRI